MLRVRSFGYTLGLYSHCTPPARDFTRIFHPVHPGARWIVEAGMVFRMYASAQGASLLETVLVTGTGPERLTRLPPGPIVNTP
jgi:Xaa-Pro aminopeptidase